MKDVIVSRKYVCSSYISMPKGLPDYYVVNKASSDSLIDQRCDVKRIVFTDVKDDCYWIYDVNDTNYVLKLRAYKK